MSWFFLLFSSSFLFYFPSSLLPSNSSNKSQQMSFLPASHSRWKLSEICEYFPRHF
jgi:hypothetical protein